MDGHPQEVHRSDIWSKKFSELQTRAIGLDATMTAAKKTAKVVKIDQTTRWLSQHFMINRALELKPFYQDFVEAVARDVKNNLTTKRGEAKRGVKLPKFHQEENRLDDEDWQFLEELNKILQKLYLGVLILEGDGKVKQVSDAKQALAQVGIPVTKLSGQCCLPYWENHCLTCVHPNR